MMDSKRKYSLDLLKIYATVMVLLLHVDGFVLEQFSEDAYPLSTLIMYFLAEAFAYPAIHLFVMIGSWFMIEKVNTLKQITKVWSQTWVVTMAGLIGFVAVVKQSPGIMGGVSCVFPFLGRAYWFVTEYIILVMLSPFLNKGIKALRMQELFTVTIIFGCAVCVLPTLLSMFPWYQDESEMANFILLYLMTACIKKVDRELTDRNGINLSDRQSNIVKILGKKAIWIVIWGLCVAALTGSAVILHHISKSHEMYFYAYNGVFVVLEALSVFMVFKHINIENEALGRTLMWIQGSSLFVYLLHMHPLFKDKYIQWGWFGYVNVKSPGIYAVQICLTVLLLFIVGTACGKAAIILSDKTWKIVNNKIEGIIIK